MSTPDKQGQPTTTEALLDFADHRQLDHLVEGMTSRDRARSTAGRVVVEMENIVDEAEQQRWTNYAQGRPIDAEPVHQEDHRVK